ncbi:hypothetical protein KCU78_g14625, partial [Aureobasidium melanogenum]
MTTALDPNNVQGDILVGFPKKTETFLFFQIPGNAVFEFRSSLARLLPKITTAQNTIDDRVEIRQHKRHHKTRLTKCGTNVAFTSKGLKKLGMTEDIGDAVFTGGMLADAQNLGDTGSTTASRFEPDWIPEFKKQMDGVILVAGDGHRTVDQQIQHINTIFSIGGSSASIDMVLKLSGDVRPGAESGHEQYPSPRRNEIFVANMTLSFGFNDGISQPAVDGFDLHPNPGQGNVPQGIILLGRDGDVDRRPSWALDGSFLAFRFLSQRVPEFNEFLVQNAPVTNDPTASASDLLGARLIGRWKSGAPIALKPFEDDPTLGVDPERNNNFDYESSQEKCPFAAHSRKMFPRSDLPAQADASHRIIRRAITYGPELSQEEIDSKTTIHDRGLLFVSYQSNISNGFQFLQKSWANNADFPPNKPQKPGFDPLIGQTSNLSPRMMTGADPGDLEGSLDMTQQWVFSKGGEYFFAPSLPTLRNVLSH